MSICILKSFKPTTDVIILYGAAVVNILKPTGCKIFGGYAEKIFTSYVKTEFLQTCRIDIVWDTYEENSLKSQTRETRCTGATLRRKVENCTPITSKWSEFLRVSEKKDRAIQATHSSSY